MAEGKVVEVKIRLGKHDVKAIEKSFPNSPVLGDSMAENLTNALTWAILEEVNRLPDNWGEWSDLGRVAWLKDRHRNLKPKPLTKAKVLRVLKESGGKATTPQLQRAIGANPYRILKKLESEGRVKGKVIKDAKAGGGRKPLVWKVVS